jgi:hypothetical protein
MRKISGKIYGSLFCGLLLFLGGNLSAQNVALQQEAQESPKLAERISGSCDDSRFDLLARQYFEPEIKFYINKKLLYLLNRDGLFVYIDKQYHPKDQETYEKLTKDYQAGYLRKKWEGRIEQNDTIVIEFNANPDLIRENPKEARYQIFHITCQKAAEWGQGEPDTLIRASEIGENGQVRIKIPASTLPREKVFIDLGCINRIGSDNIYYQVYWPFDEKYRSIAWDNAPLPK